MTEIELLRKIATESVKARKLKAQYDYELREYTRKWPHVDQRFSPKIVAHRKSITDPIYAKLKDAKRKLDGYLVIYEAKEFE
jgi:hypothetical protein